MNLKGYFFATNLANLYCLVPCAGTAIKALLPAAYITINPSVPRIIISSMSPLSGGLTARYEILKETAAKADAMRSPSTKVEANGGLSCYKTLIDTILCNFPCYPPE
ncbi:MAG: hypothetical protein ACFFFG_14855 [Candidatus Thorarchaeota archaeon]